MPIFSPAAIHKGAAPVTEKDAQSLIINLHQELISTSDPAIGAETKKILDDFRSRHSVHEIRIIAADGRILTSSDPAELGKISTATEQLAISLQKQGPLRIFNQKGAFLAAYPIYNDTPCRQCHKTSAGNLGLIALTFPPGRMRSPADKTGIRFTSSLLIFLLLLATLLIFSPVAVQAAKRSIFANPAKNRTGDNAFHEPATADALIYAGLEKEQNEIFAAGNLYLAEHTGDAKTVSREGTQKASRYANVRFQQSGKLKISSTCRLAPDYRPGSPDSGITGGPDKHGTDNLNTLQRLAAVHKVSMTTNSAMELEEVFHNLLDITINTLCSEIGYILQYDHEKESFRVRSFLSCCGMSPKYGEIPFSSNSVSTLVYKTRKPVLIRNIGDTPQFGSQSVLGFERKSLICVPLVVQDEIIGTMAVVNKVDDSTYNSEDMKFLSTIASQAGLAIKNSKLREEQQKAYMDIVHALVSIIDASDSYTKGHSDRVTFYSVELAKKINMPQKRIDIVKRAAILHDIGKIGINMYLLNKEMQLSPKETDKLRQHPLIGMKILEPLDFLRDVSICIGQHHERVDGTGYPYGIPGSRLRLESQVLAISDAYDAMTSDRPYRCALSRAEAIKELKDNSGKQHNHQLVGHFIELLESGQLDTITCQFDNIPAPYMDFETASKFITDFSRQPLLSGIDEYPQTHTCSSC